MDKDGWYYNMATIISGDSGGTAVTTSTQKILQVVHATTTTQVDSTSASFVDTGLTASITPSATSSKVLVSFAQGILIATPSSSRTQLQLVRATTAVQVYGYIGWNSANPEIIFYNNNSYLDSPSTTSATTYKIQMKTSSGVVRAQYDDGDGEQVSNIVLMEIGA